MHPRLRLTMPAAIAAAALAGAPVQAGEPLADLLGQIKPPTAPQGSVAVMGWVERNEGRSELVVTFVAKGEVKLVADPGITVTPQSREGITWAATGPVSHVDPDQAYFADPPILRLPFEGSDGEPVKASVEYAYCLVDYQCLFGEATVSASTSAPSG